MRRVRIARNTGIHSSASHGGRHYFQQTNVHRLRNDVFLTEFKRSNTVGFTDFLRHRLFGQFTDRVHRGNLHFLVDSGCTYIQRTTENEREAKHVVHLVRVVRATGRHDQIITGSQGHFRADFRIRVGTGKHHRVRSHFSQLLGRQKIRAGQTQEHVRAVDGIVQSAPVGIVGEHRLVLVQIITTRVDHTLTVEHEDVLRAHTAADQQLHAGNGGRTGAQTYHLCLFNLLALQLKSIDHAGRSYDSGTVLVIVEDGHVTLFNQRTLNLEALRCFDVLEVDTTEGIGDALNSFNKRLRAFGINLDVEDVNSGKALEQYALAFHNRLARQRAEITQTQDSGTVRNHGNQVTLGCVFVSVLGVLRDLADRFGNP